MAPRKNKPLAKERVCSDPFIVDDDDSVANSDDDYEEVSVLLLMLFLYSDLILPVENPQETPLNIVWKRKR